MNKIIEFLKMDTGSKFMFIKAYFYTGYFRAYILFRPFKKLKNKMGKLKCESSFEENEMNYFEAKKIAKIVCVASKYTLWESKCLVQALTAQKLLKSKHIKSTLYLGVSKDNDKKMIAHAWIRCGEFFVTGGEIRKNFVVVAKFCA